MRRLDAALAFHAKTVVRDAVVARVFHHAKEKRRQAAAVQWLSPRPRGFSAHPLGLTLNHARPTLLRRAFLAVLHQRPEFFPIEWPAELAVVTLLAFAAPERTQPPRLRIARDP